MYSLPNRINNLLHDSVSLSELKLLIVGVGGIGCELLKVLCKMPIGQIHIIDMDTIQISNLNRQFLFKVQHKGQSKALVAKQTIKKINPHLNIEAHHKNIRDLPIQFFNRFSHLIMALDNIETRNYVNKIGVRLNIPTIDAGTLGFKGNVHIILPHVTRCYSCQPKVSSQKSFPVCTIRMRPQKPIHCIVWAKMLFQVLFSGQEVNNDMKDLSVLAESGDQTNLLKQLLHKQIQNIKTAKTDSDSLLAQAYLKKIHPIPLDILSTPSTPNIDSFDSFDTNKIPLQQLIGLAKHSFLHLLKQKNRQGSIIFQKDDDMIIHFISSFANLRMSCFSIQQQSFNEVKNMAGNIVPAIASTNSIVSGLQVLEMVKMLEKGGEQLKSYYIQNQSYKVRGLKVELPVQDCLICSPSSNPVIVELNMKNSNFQVIITLIKRLIEELDIELQFAINKGEIELYNSYQPNKKILQRKIIDLTGGALETDLKISDEDNSQTICTFWLIDNQQSKYPKITNSRQFETNLSKNKKKRKEAENKMNESQKNMEKQEDSDDYCAVVCEDKGGNVMESDDDLVIVEVKKPQDKNQPSKQGTIQDNQQIQDLTQKKIKQN